MRTRRSRGRPLIAALSLAAVLAGCSSSDAHFEQALQEARSPDEVAALVRALARSGPEGIEAVRTFAEERPLVAFEPDHGLLVMYDVDADELWYEETLPAESDAPPGTIEAAVAAALPHEWCRWESPCRGAEPEAIEPFQSGDRYWFVLRVRDAAEHPALAARFREGKLESWTFFELTEDQIQERRTGES